MPKPVPIYPAEEGKFAQRAQIFNLHRALLGRNGVSFVHYYPVRFFMHTLLYGSIFSLNALLATKRISKFCDDPGCAENLRLPYFSIVCVTFSAVFLLTAFSKILDYKLASNPYRRLFENI